MRGKTKPLSFEGLSQSANYRWSREIQSRVDVAKKQPRGAMSLRTTSSSSSQSTSGREKQHRINNSVPPVHPKLTQSYCAGEGKGAETLGD